MRGDTVTKQAYRLSRSIEKNSFYLTHAWPNYLLDKWRLQAKTIEITLARFFRDIDSKYSGVFPSSKFAIFIYLFICIDGKTLWWIKN